MPQIGVRLTPRPQVFRRPNVAGLLEETQSALSDLKGPVRRGQENMVDFR